jgi:hypothetical protein
MVVLLQKKVKMLGFGPISRSFVISFGVEVINRIFLGFAFSAGRILDSGKF